MGLEEHVIPGKILYLNVCFPHQTKPQDKYFLIVCLGVSPLLMKINSDKKDDSDLRLKNTVYTFFPEDVSYLHCRNVWKNLITTDEIIKQLSLDDTRVKGTITEDHKNEIINRIEKAKAIERRHIKSITEALRKK